MSMQRVLRVCRSMVAAFWKQEMRLSNCTRAKEPSTQTKCCNTLRVCNDKIERVLEQIKAIRIVLGTDRSSSHLIPTWQDCDVAAAVKPLKEITNALSAEKCPSISVVKSLLNHLTTEVLVDKDRSLQVPMAPSVLISSC